VSGTGVADQARVVFTRDLQVGSVGPDVEALQKFLIAKNTGKAAIALAANGTTERFGQLTKSALKEYQKANGIVPATGNLGPKTRIFIGKNS
jgi:peptidoglycan hydrolase-like protein with peptidoglycan-binding domain